MREEQIGDQLKINAAWEGYMRKWYGLHYGLGVAAVALSVTVASKPFAVNPSNNLYNLLAWLLALITGFIAFLHPEQRGDRYRRAWSILSNEITRFKNDTSFTVNHVLDAYIRGEEIIHQTASDGKESKKVR